MNDHSCAIGGCTTRVYAPAGTGALCKDHFLAYLTWRRKKGTQMFFKYGAMPMDQRDAVVAEWAKSLAADE